MTDRRRLRGHAAGAEPKGTTLAVASVTHDVARRRSVVTLVWSDDAERTLTLPIPYGCSLTEVESMTRQALQTFAGEIAAYSILPIGEP